MIRLRSAPSLLFAFSAFIFMGGSIFTAAPLAAEPAHGIAMHGAPKYAKDYKNFDYVNPTAPKGGDIKLPAIGTFDSLNAFIIKGTPAAGLGLIYDTLTEASTDEAFSQYGLLAEGIETPEDRSWVTFTLRSDAKWHDGKPITADDVIWTFETLKAKGPPQFRFYYAGVEAVERIGERAVKFRFKPGVNRELPLILGQLTVLPKHWWEKRKFEETTLEPPLGSGPYKIDSFEPGRFITYRRADNYWGKDHPVNKGRYNFDTMRYDYYRDSTVMIEALKAGAFDFRVENSSKAWATAYDVPAVKQGVLIKEVLPHQRTSGMQGFVFNTRREIFKDPKVRQALAYAFDFEWSNKTLFYGLYHRTRSYFGNSELEAKGLPSPDELKILEPYRGRIPDEVFTTEYNPPSTEGRTIRDNLLIAAKLLKEAGWIIDPKTKKLTHQSSGKVMGFEILLDDPLFERISLPFIQNLERLGIIAKIRNVDVAQYRRLTDNFDFDMISNIWGQSMSPGNEQRDFWGSDSANATGSTNLAGIANPAIDAIIESLIAAPTREALVAQTRALDRVLQWGHWVIPHWHSREDRVLYWDKFGHPQKVPVGGTDVMTWWIDKDKAATLEARKAKLPKP